MGGANAVTMVTVVVNAAAYLFPLYSHRKARGMVETVSSWVFGTRMDAYTPGMSVTMATQMLSV